MLKDLTITGRRGGGGGRGAVNVITPASNQEVQQKVIFCRSLGDQQKNCHGKY